MARSTLSRSMHDLGLAAWFGGTLANAVALNPAAGEAGGNAALPAPRAAPDSGTWTSQWLRFAAGPASSLPSSAGRPAAAPGCGSLGSTSDTMGDSSHARAPLSRPLPRPPLDCAGVGGAAA